MGKSIGGVALKASLESSIVAELIKKCYRLKVGRSVTAIREAMTKLYNYWSIVDVCELTDDEINCIVKDIKATCGFTQPKRTQLTGNSDVDVRIEVPEQTISLLTCSISKIQGVKATAVGQKDGYGKWDVIVTGGSGAITYLWVCEAAPASGQDINGSCVDLTLTGTTTQRLAFTGVEYGKRYKFKITVTDSIGNSSVCSGLYDDRSAQAIIYETLDPVAL